MRRDWTKEETATLREYAQTKTQAEIGVILGRSPQSIANRAVKMKINMMKKGENHYGAKLSNLQVEMIRVLNQEGFNAGEIHRACFSHVSMTAVQRVVFFKTRRGAYYEQTRQTDSH